MYRSGQLELDNGTRASFIEVLLRSVMVIDNPPTRGYIAMSRGKLIIKETRDRAIEDRYRDELVA